MPRDGKKRRTLDENRFLRDFNEACGTHGLSGYYVERLNRGREFWGGRVDVNQMRFLQLREGYLAQESFRAEVLGDEVVLVVWHYHDRWYAALCYEPDRLTDAKVHELRSKMPPCYAGIDFRTPIKYVVPLGSRLDMMVALRQSEQRVARLNPHYQPHNVTPEQLLNVLLRGLQEHGLPVTVVRAAIEPE